MVADTKVRRWWSLDHKKRKKPDIKKKKERDSSGMAFALCLYALSKIVAIEPSGKARVVVALYGIQNRDRGCAWASQQKNVINVLRQQNLDVDIFRYDLMPADGDIVDKIVWHPRAEPLVRFLLLDLQKSLSDSI